MSDTMLKCGDDFGGDECESGFGQALIDFGKTMRELSDVKDNLVSLIYTTASLFSLQ